MGAECSSSSQSQSIPEQVVIADNIPVESMQKNFSFNFRSYKEYSVKIETFKNKMVEILCRVEIANDFTRMNRFLL